MASKPEENVTEGQARRYLTETNLLTKGVPSVYQLQLQTVQTGNNGDLIKCSFGKDLFKHSIKTIMVLGATGSGKTTLINAMVNYILGVEWDDDFRYKLIHEQTNKSQAESQTSSVTAYELNYQEGFRIPYSLVIVDTPEFGDTRGIERDQLIIQQIRECFTSPQGIDQVDAIGFVVQASLARLTSTQKYIFHSILSIFGKDVAENICILVTFTDGQPPTVLEAIKQSAIPCALDNEGQPICFKFNNSAIFAKNVISGNCDSSSDDDNFEKMFWKMGLTSNKNFFISLNTMPTKSLCLTKQVLEEREQLNASLEGLKSQIDNYLTKMEEIRETEKALHVHDAEVKKNINFDYQVKVTEVRTQNIRGRGRFITNCQNCKFTCHFPCRIKLDEHKHGCRAIVKKTGLCRVCPGHCVWSVHIHQHYKYVYCTKNVMRNYHNLKQEYEKLCGKKVTQEKILEELKRELTECENAVAQLAKESARCLERLNEIALRPNPLSTPDYINLLIESEKREGNAGYLERIESLNGVKTMAELMEAITKLKLTK